MPPRQPPLGEPLPPRPGQNPLIDIIILPRQPGESAYQYRYRRTVTLYGQTPYQRRIFLARQRGVSVSAARGHGIRAGESESQRRNRLSREATGFSVSQLRRRELRAWLEENGYTPETTAMTWTQLLRLAARLRWMNTDTPVGSHVTPEMILEARELEDEGSLETGWAFERLWQKYDDMLSYRQFADKEPGRNSWVEYQQVHVYIPSLAPQWWYYH